MIKKQRGQGIARVSDLFKKYRETLRAPQGAVIQAFKDVVQEHLGVSIERMECTYTVATRTITLRGSGMVKTEILLQKQALLSILSQKLGEKNAPQEIL